MHLSIDNILDKKVGDIVSGDIRTADVFKDFGIDYCCRGDRVLGEVCRDRGIKIQTLFQALERAMSDSKGPVHDYKNWSIPFLIDFINNTHHPYVRSSLPVLIQLGEKVSKAHGGHHPETFEVLDILKSLERELLEHLREEEENDFPVLLELTRTTNTKLEELFTEARRILQNLKEDHITVGDQVLKIERLTSNFTLPEDACNTYRVYYKKLTEFRDDLFNHIHLENNILFYKVSSLLDRLEGDNKEK